VIFLVRGDPGGRADCGRTGGSAPNDLIREAVGLADGTDADVVVDEVAASGESPTIDFLQFDTLDLAFEHVVGGFRQQAFGFFEKRAHHHDIGRFG
jgi:hypothetical protein